MDFGSAENHKRGTTHPHEFENLLTGGSFVTKIGETLNAWSNSEGSVSATLNNLLGRQQGMERFTPITRDRPRGIRHNRISDGAFCPGP